MKRQSQEVRAVGRMLILCWRAEPRVVLIITLLSLLMAGALAFSGVAQRLIVDGTEASSQIKVVLAVLLGATAYTATAACNRIVLIYQTVLEKKLDLELHKEILGITTTLPTLEHFETAEFLDRLSILRSNVSVIAGSCWQILGTARACVSLLAVVALLLEVNVGTLVLVVGAIAPLVAAQWAQRKVVNVTAQQTENLRHEEALHNLCTTPSSATEIILSGSEIYLDKEAYSHHHEASQAIVRVKVWATATQVAGWILYAASYGLAVALVAQSALQNQATVGDLVLVLTIGLRLTTEVRAAVLGYSGIASALEMVSHYVWLQKYRDPSQTGPAPRVVPKHLKELFIDDVTFTYPDSDVRAIDSLSLRIGQGSTVALVGENGSGKSTLVKLLSGMYRPTSGVIRVNGTDVNQLDVDEWRLGVSVGYQDAAKFEVPLREAVRIGDLPSKGRRSTAVWTALRKADAQDLPDGLPQGVDTQLGLVYGGVELSGGQWQRVSIARALMRPEPLLLIFDEPTAALDPIAEYRFYKTFKRESSRDGVITLLVTHRLAAVRDADLIVVMADGRILEQGTHDELVLRSGRYSFLHQLQAGEYQSNGPQKRVCDPPN